MDVYVEDLVKQKKTPKIYSLMALIVLAAIILSVILFYFTLIFSALSFIFLLLIAGVIYGAWYLIGSMRVEYEYIVTNGDMDVDKIMSQRKRKRLITVKLKDFELMAPVNGKFRHEFETKKVALTIDASVNKDQADAWFMIINHPKKGMVKLVFTPNERILNAAKLYNPRNLFTN